jgi:putative ABC transport system permease protein
MTEAVKVYRFGEVSNAIVVPWENITNKPNLSGNVYAATVTDTTIIKIPAGVGYTINSIKGVAVDAGTCTVSIKINGVNFMVTGTFKITNSQGDSEEEANTIFIPFTTFGKAFNRGDNVGWMAITAYDQFSITDVKEQVFDFLKTRHRVHPDDERAFGHRDLAEQFEKVNGLFNILTVVGFFVGALILMSGIIGISNIMLIVVKERTKEIGVRRALGATPWDIKSQVLQESLVLTLLAGMVGVAFSAGVIYVMNYAIDINGPVENFVNPSVGMPVVFAALTILIVSGLLAGLIPANIATKMKPVDALRTE